MRAALVLLALCSVTLAGDYSLYEPVRLVARPDYGLGMVFIERWRGDYYLGVERVVSISDYLDYRLRQSAAEAWQERTRRAQEQRELEADASGLIPDIELPALPIFGEGSRIDISGRDRITFGGRQTFVSGTSQTTNTGGFGTELKFNQQLSVVLNGTIGERTKVSIDHDSERQEGQNKILLSYTGTEDEVVQSVELGDTRLTIPGTFYTGDLPARKGLFGASARGKLAGIDVYAIASREESQGQSQSFTGRRRVLVDTIYDGQYVSRRFYLVPETAAISRLRVYVDDRIQSNNQSAFKSIATVWPLDPGRVPDSTGWTYDRAPGDFDLKTLGRDYVLHPGNVIEFSTQLGEYDVVGLEIYSSHDTIGGSRYNDSLVLLLLKPERPDSLSLTWDHELRNVYALRQSEVALSSFRLLRDETTDPDPEAETDGSNAGRKFTQILGLDPDDDGTLDYPLFDSKSGLIWFPLLRPFASTGLSVRDSVVYRKTQSSFTTGEGRRYFMVVQYSSATESYYLGQLDITEGTAKVIVNGEALREGDDYTINYRTGTLTFIKQLPPDANIQVTYEYRPLFSMSQKSLVGTRAEWNPSPQAKVGTSIFYRSEGTYEEKPSLGSEPFRRMIAEADASYAVSSDAVSAFLDRLPLLRAQSATRFDAAAEGAVSLPDPNTRGVAFLDDFEGTNITRELSISSLLWSWASVPASRDSSQFATAPIFWHNPRTNVRNDTVFGPGLGDEGSQRHDYLRVIFTPDSGDTASWAGIMTSPSQIGMNLKDIDNLEMVLRAGLEGNVHVTVGMSIDEDAPRRNRAGRIVGLDGRLNTEDRDQNGVLQDYLEDTGLDTLFAPDSLYGSDTTPDDYNDDYDPDTNPMGTEGNNRLDGEDLDHSGFSRYNHYFEFTIPLSDARLYQSLYNGWRLFRVPLHDSTLYLTFGRPRWEDIRLVRVWFDGFTETETLDFYSVSFTGTSWTNLRLYDLAAPDRPADEDTTGQGWRNNLPDVPAESTERIWVAQISKKTDTSYVPPVEPKRNTQGQLEQEPALLFGYRNLRPDRLALASKVTADRQDFRDYTDVRLYVHEDGNGLQFLLRLGTDSLNYYEYRAPITSGLLVPGRDGKWFEFAILLDSLPVLKTRRDSLPVRSDTLTSGSFRLRGNPTLADVRYTAIGIVNPDAAGISGAVWFDELRLSGPHKEPGLGFQARANLTLSDFVTAGVNLSYSDPNFRRFSEGREVKTGGFGTTSGASIRANADRLLPAGWGLTLPFSYTLSQERNLPKFSADYSDLRLTRAAGARELSQGLSRDIAIDNVRKQKSSSKLLNYTLEAMGFSWRRHEGWRSAALATDSSNTRSLQWSYSVSPDLKLKLNEDNDLALFPQSIRLAATESRRHDRRVSWRRRATDPAAFDTLRDSVRAARLGTEFGVEYAPLEDLSFEYGVTTERDLTVPPGDSLALSRWLTSVYRSLGTEAGRDHNFEAGYDIELGEMVTPSVDYSGDYSDDRLKSGQQYLNSRNMGNSGGLDFSLGLDLPEMLSRLESSKRRTPRTAPKPDTLKGDSTPPRTPGPSLPELLQRGAAALGQAIEPVDLSYSIDRSSDLVAVKDMPPWYYRLGFLDAFSFSDTALPTSIIRERNNTARVSSGGRVGELTARIGFDWSEGRQYRGILRNTNVSYDRSMTWPDLTLSLGKVQNLLKRWATDSRLSSTFRRRTILSGEILRDSAGRESLGMFGRSLTNNSEFSPLLSWQTTWKKHISTTISANYTLGSTFSFLNEAGTNRSEVNSATRGLELSLTYSFSAPQGIKLPFLRKVRFSSDLSVSWSVRYANTLRRQRAWLAGVPETWTAQQDDNSVSTTLGASYRFSRSIEAGLNTGYSRNKGLAPTTTETMDLDIWVLFRF